MTRQEKSTESIPLSDQKVQNDQPAPRSTLHRRIWRKIVTVRWRELITASIIVLDLFLLYASISLIGVFFPTEASFKGASLFVTGVIIGTTPLAVTFLAPVIGYLLPILRIPFSIVTGLIIVGGVYIGLGLAIYLPSGWPFITVCIVLRFIEGVGTALFLTAGYTLITQLYPKSTGFIVGIAEVGSGVGYAAGPVIGGFLYKAGGYRLPFFSLGGLYFVLAVPIFFILITSSQKSTRQLLHIKIVLGLLKNFTIFLIILGVLLQMAGFGFQGTTYSLFLEKQFGLTPDKIGLVFLANAVPYAAFAPLSGLLADKISPRSIVVCGLLVAGSGYLLIGPTPVIPVHPYVRALWLSIIGDILMGAGCGQTIIAAFPDISSVISAHFPELTEVSESDSSSDREKIMGIIAGMISAGMSFGEFVGPIVGGGLTDLLGFRATASIVGEVLLALMAILLMISVMDHCLSTKTKEDRLKDLESKK